MKTEKKDRYGKSSCLRVPSRDSQGWKQKLWGYGVCINTLYCLLIKVKYIFLNGTTAAQLKADWKVCRTKGVNLLCADGGCQELQFTVKPSSFTAVARSCCKCFREQNVFYLKTRSAASPSGSTFHQFKPRKRQTPHDWHVSRFTKCLFSYQPLSSIWKMPQACVSGCSPWISDPPIQTVTTWGSSVGVWRWLWTLLEQQVSGYWLIYKIFCCENPAERIQRPLSTVCCLPHRTRNIGPETKCSDPACAPQDWWSLRKWVPVLGLLPAAGCPLRCMVEVSKSAWRAGLDWSRCVHPGNSLGADVIRKVLLRQVSLSGDVQGEVREMDLVLLRSSCSH